MHRGRWAAWFSRTLICVATLTIAWASTYSASYQVCEAERSESGGNQHDFLQEIAYFAICEGTVLDANGILITALATIAIALFTLSLRRSTDKLWQAGQQALETTERAYVVIPNFEQELTTALDHLRPALRGQIPMSASGRDLGLEVTRYAAQPLWENVGNTPTRHMTVQVDWGDVGRVGTYRSDPQPFFVAPKATEPSEMHEIHGLSALIQDGMAGTLGPAPLLLFWGRAEYEDVFGNPHWLEWCYRLRPERHKGDSLEVHFIQWGDYNGSD